MADSKSFKAWLEKIQQESWQLELIISGFALFGIKEGFGLVKKIELSSNFEASDISFYFMFGLGALRIVLIILFINLLIHVFLRSLWIGAIGLRYVSGDIEFDRLNYSQKFTNFLKKKIGTFDSYISKLEDWCSVLFANAFLLTFILISFFAFLSWPLILISFEFNPGFVGQVISFVVLFLYFILGFVFFIDLLFFGIIKKIKSGWITSLYFWIYRIFTIITFTFLYRPLLLNFLDSRLTRKLYFLAAPFLIIILMYPSYKVIDFRHFDNYP